MSTKNLTNCGKVEHGIEKRRTIGLQFEWESHRKSAISQCLTLEDAKRRKKFYVDLMGSLDPEMGGELKKKIVEAMRNLTNRKIEIISDLLGKIGSSMQDVEQHGGGALVVDQKGNERFLLNGKTVVVFYPYTVERISSCEKDVMLVKQRYKTGGNDAD